MEKTLSAGLCMVLVLSAAFAGLDLSGNVEGKSVEATAFAGGTGIVEDPYIITNVWELQNMSMDLGANYSLGNDIDASITSGWNWDTVGWFYKGFAPVGNLSNPFTGTLDGNSRIITGLYIDLIYVWPEVDYAGLFGCVAIGGVVCNVGVAGYSITGHEYNGPIVGYNAGTVTNSYASGTITAVHNSGGLVGYNAGTVQYSHAEGTLDCSNIAGGLIGYNTGLVDHSYATQDFPLLEGGSRFGGLIGQNAGTVQYSHATGYITSLDSMFPLSDVGGLVGFNDGTVLNSYATGNVTGFTTDIDSYIGGLVGSNYGTISNSFAAGSVAGRARIGGFVGRNRASISNSYATGATTGYSYTGGLVGDDNTGVVSQSYSTGATIGTGGTYIGGLIGYQGGDSTDSYWDTQTSGQATSSGGTGKTTAEMMTQATFVGWDFGNTWAIKPIATYPQLRSILYSSGNGTLANPYIITNVWELQNISMVLNAQYALGNDIDASITSGWNAGAGFVPVGTPATPFRGSLDGRNHTITGLFVNRPGLNGVGLIGVTATGGFLKDIRLLSCDVTGNDWTGALVGWNEGFSIRGSHATGDVTGSSMVGGLIGINFNNAAATDNCQASVNVHGTFDSVGGLVGYNAGPLSNSFADGTVVSVYFVGGLAGMNNNVITNSYSCSSTDGYSEVGGLVGHNEWGSISKCYAYGNTHGDFSVGGLVGYNNMATIDNCYAYGDTSGDFTIAGLVGDNEMSTITNSYACGPVTGLSTGGLVAMNMGTVTGCYWDMDTTGQIMSDGGTEKTTAEMKTLTTYSGWDFSTIWWIVEGITYPDLWPLNAAPVFNMDTSESFLTIQDAIDDADTLDGHTLLVSNGTFPENVIINKELTLIGSGNTTINPVAGNSVEIYTENVEISGFTILSASYGIYLEAGGFNIHENLFDTTMEAIYLDIELVNPGSVTLGDMHIDDNVIIGNYGIFFNEITFDTPNPWSNITVGNISICDNYVNVSNDCSIEIYWNAVGSMTGGNVTWGDTIFTGNTVTAPGGIYYYGSIDNIVNATVDLGDIVISDNDITAISQRGIFLDWWDIYEIYGSDITAGRTVVDNNTVDSFSEGVDILFDSLYTYRDNASIAIGDFSVSGNNITTHISDGIIMNDGSSWNMFHDMDAGTSAYLGDIDMSRNTIVSPTDGILLDLFFDDTTLSHIGNVTMNGNDITTGDLGIYIPDLSFFNLVPGTDISVGDTLISGNSIETANAGSWAIVLEWYAMYYIDNNTVNWGDVSVTNNTIDAANGIYFYGDVWEINNSTVAIGGLDLSGNTMNVSEDEGIDLDWWDIQYILDGSSIIVGETRICGNSIESSSECIYVMFDLIEYIDDSSLGIGGFTISDNTLSCPDCGIFFDSSAFAVLGANAFVHMGALDIQGNIFTDCWFGLYVEASLGMLDPNDADSSSVHNNLATGCDIGLAILSGVGFRIYENTMQDSMAGMFLEDGSGSVVYHNRFLNSSFFHAFDGDANASWDAGYPLGGNYWDDYTGTDMFSGPGQDQMGPDGFGDAPYTGIDNAYSLNDNYPLIQPFGTPSGGAVMITNPGDGELVSGTIMVEAAVTGMNIYGVNFYVNGVLEGFDPTNNYQFILDTTTLPEDAPFTLTAEAVFVLSPPINTTLDLVPNNDVDAGNYISAGIPEPEYSPDEIVSVQIDIINAPPAFDSLDVTIGLEGPSGYTQYASAAGLQPDDMYTVTVALPSDAALGTWNVLAEASGYVGASLVWTANDTATFDVVGQSVQDQLGDINQTVGGMNSTLTAMNISLNDISITLDNMNITLAAVSGDIAAMNTSLAAMMNDLDAQLAAVNASLHASLAQLENDFLAELAGVNASLASDIQNMMADITVDLAGLNVTLGGRLIALEGNISGNISDLNDWLDLLLREMDANLTATNATLHQQMADLEATVTGFYNDLAADLLDVMDRLLAIDANLTTHDVAVFENITALSDLMVSLDSLSLAEMRSIISQLALNLSAHDAGIGADLLAIAGDIGDFQDLTDGQLQSINSTLDDLVKLDGIISDLEELDQALQDAEAQLSANIEAASDSQMSKMDLNTILLVILLVLALVSIVIGLRNRGGGKTQESEGTTEPISEDEKSEETEETASE